MLNIESDLRNVIIATEFERLLQLRYEAYTEMKIFPAWKREQKSRWYKMALAWQKIESSFLFEGQK